jgi:threonine dehydrogenase-like Zn-dependent dehydrogenase
MRALLCDGNLTLDREYPLPERRPDESLIRVKIAGICNTDLEIARGYMGYSGILGHEFVGIVEDTDTSALLGKRVVGEINIRCGSCEFCRSAMPTHCPKRTVLGIMGKPGVMADYCTLPDSNLHVVPDGLSDEVAVFCEPLAAAFEITEHNTIRPGQKTVVLGDGKLGLLVAQVLKNAGADVLLVGHSPDKLARAEAWSIPAVVESEMSKDAADMVVDCTGTTQGFALALELVKPRGTIVLKTTVADTFSINLAPLVINEITVVGSRCGPFEPALTALSNGSVRVTDMISRIFAMDQALEAFEYASQPGILKVLINME